MRLAVGLMDGTALRVIGGSNVIPRHPPFIQKEDALPACKNLLQKLPGNDLKIMIEMPGNLLKPRKNHGKVMGLCQSRKVGTLSTELSAKNSTKVVPTSLFIFKF